MTVVLPNIIIIQNLSIESTFQNSQVLFLRKESLIEGPIIYLAFHELGFLTDY